jgi:hypothetical protein
MSSQSKPDTDDKAKVTYTGSCHCNAVQFRIEYPKLDTEKLIECDCSICLRNGYLFVYVPPEDFKYTVGGEDKLTVSSAYLS